MSMPILPGSSTASPGSRCRSRMYHWTLIGQYTLGTRKNSPVNRSRRVSRIRDLSAANTGTAQSSNAKLKSSVQAHAASEKRTQSDASTSGRKEL